MLSVLPSLQPRVELGYKDVVIVIANSIRNVTEIFRSEQDGQKYNKTIFKESHKYFYKIGHLNIFNSLHLLP